MSEITKTGIALTRGPNSKREPGRVHEELHAPCGCAFHQQPAPHWHPCLAHRPADVAGRPSDSDKAYALIAEADKFRTENQPYRNAWGDRLVCDLSAELMRQLARFAALQSNYDDVHARFMALADAGAHRDALVREATDYLHAVEVLFNAQPEGDCLAERKPTKDEAAYRAFVYLNDQGALLRSAIGGAVSCTKPISISAAVSRRPDAEKWALWALIGACKDNGLSKDKLLEAMSDVVNGKGYADG